MMRKLASAAALPAGLFLAVTKAFALTEPTNVPGLSTATTGDEVTDSVLAVLLQVLDFVMFLGVIFIIIAGIRLIISGGDEGAKDAAKKTIIYVIAGIIIIFFARTIVAFTVNALEGT